MRYVKACANQAMQAEANGFSFDTALFILNNCINTKKQETTKQQNKIDTIFLVASLFCIITLTLFFLLRKKNATAGKNLTCKKNIHQKPGELTAEVIIANKSIKQPIRQRLPGLQKFLDNETTFSHPKNRKSPLRRPGKKGQIKSESVSAQTPKATTSTLPTEICFHNSDGLQFIYPTPTDADYILCPLPGIERAKPVARVTLNGQSQLIYTSHFGVLILKKTGLSEEDILVHKKCLENGDVVYDKRVSFFKTHPRRTSGDQRIYATHQVKNQDDLALHFFDTPIDHAHHKQ